MGFGWGPLGCAMGMDGAPKPIQTRCGWDGWAFFFWMGISRQCRGRSSARESANSRGPPERQAWCDPRQARPFYIQKPGIKTMRPYHWVSHMGLRARAAVSVLANSSASGVSTTPNSTLAITFQATVVDDGRLRAGRWTSSRLHGRGRPISGEGLYWAAERTVAFKSRTDHRLKHYAFEGFFALSK